MRERQFSDRARIHVGGGNHPSGCDGSRARPTGGRRGVEERGILQMGIRDRAEVARLIAESGRPVEQWGPAEAARIASLGGRVQDPLIAQALMDAIRPECLGRLVERLLTQAYACLLYTSRCV